MKRNLELHQTSEQLAERIAELERTNAELAHASHTKSEFLASMSHEIRTPLNAINGFAELLSDKTYGDMSPQQERFVSRIIEAGQHLLQLVNDVLDIAKIEAGRIEIDRQPVRVNSAIESTVTITKGIARNRGIRIEIQPDETDAVVDADDRRLKQILFNLLSNAIKYSDAETTVTVQARLSGDMVKISVTDRGVGIPLADQERIFEEFERVETASRTAEGAGLGLALSRKLVRLQGGDLGLTSTPGEGSTFWFTLPVAHPEEDRAGDMSIHEAIAGS